MGRLTVVVTALVVAACGASAGSTPSPINIDASWPTAYGSIADLNADADVALVGVVTAVTYDGPDPQDSTLPLSTYAVTVERVMAGSASGVIALRQTGGITNGVRHVVGDDPLMNVGQRYLLFLRRVPNGPVAGDYFVLGGGQGRFVVQSNGTLAKVAATPVTLPPGATVDSVATTLAH